MQVETAVLASFLAQALQRMKATLPDGQHVYACWFDQTLTLMPYGATAPRPQVPRKLTALAALIEAQGAEAELTHGELARRCAEAVAPIGPFNHLRCVVLVCDANQPGVLSYHSTGPRGRTIEALRITAKTITNSTN